MGDIEDRIHTVYDALTTRQYKWRVIEASTGYRWELEKAPIRVVIEISYDELLLAQVNPDMIKDIVDPHRIIRRFEVLGWETVGVAVYNAKGVALVSIT